MNKRIVLSSGNINKVKEIKDILSELSIDIISKDELGLKDFDVIEDEDTLEGNAFKKAFELSKLVDGIVIADDTGLFVDALDGAPGVYSARYAGEHVTYKDNNDLLLKNLDGIPIEKRTAHFRTVIAVVSRNGLKLIAEGICKGRIGFELQGENGFGYDPLFIVDSLGKTFAQMTEEEKNMISHRAIALKNLKKLLGEVLV